MLKLNPDIQEYAHQHTTPEPELIQELIETSDRELEYIDMLSGRVVGRLLNMLVKITGARRVLEIGMFTGYSALMMAEALPEDGELQTCDLNEKYASIARSFFERSKNGHKIHVNMGEALESLEKLEGPFDMIFIDADKGNYPNYYRQALPKLKSGGVMVVDNVFLAENVLDPQDEKAEAVDELNKLIADDDRVEQVMLTERDGLMIVRKL
ncbi:class I SAM-dependent methyltransferase [Aliifodinibius sp. S!AR15-10]|uniref:O-methyltransferase n=1 Tax=Aliifodinibius sp. S!AR15-10 TaxID=2950437 RepID=UPI002859FB41|nr:class I SAM-dependent methyltransferase [Aliifodinibius sp. S!AR15-10]MDR8391823.1 class I SAM-dependent methyltransferase [Aliifodinibius sp. S!AR15-10]